MFQHKVFGKRVPFRYQVIRLGPGTAVSIGFALWPGRMQAPVPASRGTIRCNAFSKQTHKGSSASAASLNDVRRERNDSGSGEKTRSLLFQAGRALFAPNFAGAAAGKPPKQPSRLLVCLSPRVESCEGAWSTKTPSGAFHGLRPDSENPRGGTASPDFKSPEVPIRCQPVLMKF
jgi:hypothetical protein